MKLSSAFKKTKYVGKEQKAEEVLFLVVEFRGTELEESNPGFQVLNSRICLLLSSDKVIQMH